MTKVAVVILNWNGKKLLEQYLPSVIQHSQQAHENNNDGYSSSLRRTSKHAYFKNTTKSLNPTKKTLRK